MKPNFDLNPKPAPAPSFIGGKGSSLVDALKAQQDASALIPTIQSPPPPTLNDIGPRSLNYQTIIVPAQKSYPVQIKGDFVYIEGIQYNGVGGFWQYSEIKTLSLRTDTLQTSIFLSEAYREIRFPTPYSYIEFINDVNAPVTITFWSGFGGTRRDRNNAVKTTHTTTQQTVALAIPKNHFLCDGPIQFLEPVSHFVSSSILLSSVVTLYNGTGTMPDCSLWLFAENPGIVTGGDPFIYNPSIISPPIGKITLRNAVSGHAGSNAATVFSDNLNIPVWTGTAGAFSGGYFLSQIWGYLVSDVNYTSTISDQWDTTLAVRYS